MNLTLGNSRSAVNRKLEEVGATTHFSGVQGLATVADAINEACRTTIIKTKSLMKEFDIATVALTREYDVPADFLMDHFVVIYDTNTPIYKREVNQLVWQSPDTGQPSWYYMIDVLASSKTKRRIGFSPTPDQVYTVKFFYNAMPSTMVSDGDYCDVPDQYQDLIIEEATALLLEVDKRFQEAGAFRQRIPQMLSDMQQTEEKTGPSQVVNAMWDYSD